MGPPPKDYTERIHGVVAALAHRVTAEEVAEGLATGMAGELGARAAVVGLFDEARRRIPDLIAVGYPAELLDRWRSQAIDESPLMSAVRGGEVFFFGSRLTDVRFDTGLASLFGDGGGFVVPLQASGQILGCVGASFDRVHVFDDGERDFILALAALSAQSIERARLFEAERTARANADAAHRRLELVLQQLPIAIAIVATDGSAVFNEEVGRIYGTPTRGVAKVRPASYPASMMKHANGVPFTEEELPIVRAMRGQTVSGQEMAITRMDGEMKHVRVNAGPVLDDHGRITSVVAAFADINHERHHADELRASQRRHRAVMRATNDVIWELDLATNRAEWSDTLERVVGYQADEANAHPGGGHGWWKERVHEQDRARVLEGFASALEGGENTWSAEYRFRWSDGSYRQTLDRCVIERDASGRAVGAVGAFTDVSEQHLLLEELRHAVAVRDDFLSVAGHELRTPLAALSAQILGLQQLPLDDSTRAKKLAAAERQIRRLTTLVDELLNMTRIAHDTLRLEADELDLAALVREAAARLADDFLREGARLDVEAPHHLTGRWDRARLELVVTNLIANALRHGERQPVRVRVEELDGVARVVVEDRGPGIRPEDRERIFERFVRDGSSRPAGGLGVGLWLSRQIVEAHGGRLTLDGESGVGARFTVELPRGLP